MNELQKINREPL